MRVLLTGMGGDFGAKTAALIEADPAVEAILGIDAYPPRRRLRRCDFLRIDPRDRTRTAEAVRNFAPTVVIHLGVWEPDAHAEPAVAHQRTMDGTRAALGAALATGALEHVLVRSGIEVYGRGPRTPRRPTEDDRARPTSPYGRTLLAVEREAAAVGRMAEVPVSVLRFAPTVGVQYPSPLVRLLRLPAVPVNALSLTALEPAEFCLLDVEDAATAFVLALRRRLDGVVNVVGDGSITPYAAARLGGRVPVPILPLGWIPTRAVSRVVGTPVPAHLHELLTRGRLADGGRAAELLGAAPTRTTADVVAALYDWAPVVYSRPSHAA